VRNYVPAFSFILDVMRIWSHFKESVH